MFALVVTTYRPGRAAPDQMADSGDRSAALVHFVGSVRTEDLHALQRALANLESGLVQSRAGGSGIVAVTTVPAPGRERMVSVPPTSSARSDIDSSP